MYPRREVGYQVSFALLHAGEFSRANGALPTICRIRRSRREEWARGVNWRGQAIPHLGASEKRVARVLIQRKHRLIGLLAIRRVNMEVRKRRNRSLGVKRSNTVKLLGKHRYPPVRHIHSCIFVVGGKAIRLRHDHNLEIRPLEVFQYYVWSEVFQGSSIPHLQNSF
jgi:hypothetical protein